MSNRIKQHAIEPSLDGMHFALHEENAKARRKITASEYRPSSGEDWLAFLDRAEREDLTVQQRQSILADNARRFFNL